jgi:exodeoxyribonuclease VII large subunit
MWRNAALRLPFTPRDGQAIEAHGSLNIYEAGGQYQLYIDAIRPAGEGQLYQQFLRLKARLEAEGLFQPERKRPIPRWPHRIGLVTSPTGAALRDMLNIFRRRYPVAEVILAPTAVQGDEAPAGIIAAIEGLNRYAQVDLILLARGGGSIEDLWAFNDERVAYTIAASKAPIISGVGHETDFTIADFVCDLRAPTPTAAAELASPDLQEMTQVAAALTQRLQQRIQSGLFERRRGLEQRGARLQSRSPLALVRSQRQRVVELTRSAARVQAHTLQLQRTHISGLEKSLQALNPLAVLQRGYALVTDAKGRLVKTVRQATPGDGLTISVQDGAIDVQVRQVKPDSGD